MDSKLSLGDRIQLLGAVITFVLPNAFPDIAKSTLINRVIMFAAVAWLIRILWPHLRTVPRLCALVTVALASCLWLAAHVAMYSDPNISTIAGVSRASTPEPEPSSTVAPLHTPTQSGPSSTPTPIPSPPLVPEPKPKIPAFDLSNERRKRFLELLTPPPKDAEALRIGCLAWSEKACIAAGKFLLLFSEAGWRIDSDRVFRLDTAIPVDGINLDVHIDKEYTDNLPPHMGHWEKMSPGQIKIWSAFTQMNVPYHGSSSTEIPAGTLGVYFALEPDVESK